MKLSPPLRILLFAVSVAVIIPLSLWLLIQFYEWSCSTWIACDEMRHSTYQ